MPLVDWDKIDHDAHETARWVAVREAAEVALQALDKFLAYPDGTQPLEPPFSKDPLYIAHHKLALALS